MRPALLWSALAFALALGVALGPLEGVPHVQDEVVYQWQAQLLATGRLFQDTPSPEGAYAYHFLLDLGGARTGAFPLGWPLLLALGTLLGAAALVNPLLHGLTVFLGVRLAERVAGLPSARFVGPVLALSPQLVLLGASRMSHTLVAALAMGVLLLLERRRWQATLGAGALVGLVVLTRPLDAVVLAVVASGALAYQGRWRELLALAVGPSLGALAQLGLNAAVTGSAGVFPVSAYFEGPPPTPDPGWRYAPGCNAMGFGADRGCFPTWGELGHDPRKALGNLGRQLANAGRLWLGAAPFLLLAAWALRVQELRRLAATALALWALVGLGYALYWVPGAAYGARFHHLAAAPVVTVAALGLARLPRLPGWAGWLLLLPLGLRLGAALPELRAYWGVDGRYSDLERRWTAGPALVLVAYSGPPMELDSPQTTGSSNHFGARFWRGGWVPRAGELRYAEYQPELVDALQQQHPGLDAWLYIHHADRAEDQLIPLSMMASGPQRPSLALPVAPFEMAPIPAPVISPEGPLP